MPIHQNSCIPPTRLNRRGVCRCEYAVSAVCKYGKSQEKLDGEGKTSMLLHDLAKVHGSNDGINESDKPAAEETTTVATLMSC